MQECTVTKYDTYIEYRFFERLETCIKDRIVRNRIKDAWNSDKSLYTDILKTVEFEFIHYSLHDASHSVSILQSIFLLLGKKKIDRLSVGDLWLLLECAYSHDIGMATDHNELINIWKKEDEIDDLVNEILLSDDNETIEAYNMIKEWQKNNSIKTNDDFFKNHALWPLEIRRSVTYINSVYIRKRHSKRSQEKIESLIEEKGKLQLEERLYKIVGIIDYLHCEDFEKIDQMLRIQETGFETDKMHPQFIAQLLRVGDVLDIRNNRFNERNMIYNGKLPHISERHYKKHKSVNHFLVDEEKVEVYIHSDDLDVCRNGREWLDEIERQLGLLIKCWNVFSPRCIGGHRIKKIDLEVRYKGNIFTSDAYNGTLKTDSKKLMELLTGENFYNTRLIFFREYIQNGVDATKMRIAQELSQDKEFMRDLPNDDIKLILPNDIKTSYFKNYPMVINIDESQEHEEKFKVQIIDHGLGMDTEGLDALFNVGKGWRGRKGISRIFNKIPDWLKPTGGFGIGFLSGFLMCDKIIVKTKSLYEPQYILTITSPSKGAKIEKMVNNSYYGDIGSTIELEISYADYYYEITEFRKSLDYKSNNPKEKKFNVKKKSDMLEFVHSSLLWFIEEFISDLIVPIEVNIPSYKVNGTIKKDNIYDFNKFENNDYMTYSYWDNYINALVRIDLHEKKDKMQFGYKGFDINRRNIHDLIKEKDADKLFTFCDNYIKNIDIFSGNVSDILLITRNNFKKDYDLEKKLEYILLNYLEVISTKKPVDGTFKIDSKLFKLMIVFNKDIRGDKKYAPLLDDDSIKYAYIYLKDLFDSMYIEQINNLISIASKMGKRVFNFVEAKTNTDEFIDTMKNYTNEFITKYNELPEDIKIVDRETNFSQNLKALRDIYTVLEQHYVELNHDTLINAMQKLKEVLDVNLEEIIIKKVSLIEELTENQKVFLLTDDSFDDDECEEFDLAEVENVFIVNELDILKSILQDDYLNRFCTISKSFYDNIGKYIYKLELLNSEEKADNPKNGSLINTIIENSKAENYSEYISISDCNTTIEGISFEPLCVNYNTISSEFGIFIINPFELYQKDLDGLSLENLVNKINNNAYLKENVYKECKKCVSFDWTINLAYELNRRLNKLTKKQFRDLYIDLIVLVLKREFQIKEGEDK